MAQFSNQSKAKLETCHIDLQTVFNEVVKGFDCTVLCGHRNEQDQINAYVSGKSNLQFPHSKHNSYPSLAVDVIAYPIDWNNYRLHYCFGGFVLGVCFELGIELRWGGDWDGDRDVTNQSFNDLVHFELVHSSQPPPRNA